MKKCSEFCNCVPYSRYL